MSKNKYLNRAKAAKKDEFYTRYEDIANEIEEYYKYNPNFLKDKTVLLPCDDHKKSNFVKYFSTNFERFGIKKLMATGVSLDGKGSTYFVRNKLKVIRKSDDGNAYGDFRNEYVTALRDEADVIFTNPPFSLFREFFSWCKGKEFSIIGNLNIVSNKLIINELVSGVVKVRKHCGKFEGIALGCACWFSTFGFSIHKPLRLSSKASIESLQKFDNYDALNVDRVANIPAGYMGALGVPITYLLKHNPEQFDLLGLRYGTDGKYLTINGKETYIRVLIKHRATS